MKVWRVVSLFAVGTFAFAASTLAITVGQIDNFQDGTFQNWSNGGAPGVPPVLNISNGGPAGVGDNFIQINSVGGTGPGKFLTVYNRDQWTGDYIAAGITAIEVDLQNQGNVDLNIRLAFKPTVFGQTGYLSTSIFLPAGSDWTHAIFLINPASLIAVGVPSTFSTFFTDIQELRIVNEAGTANLSGDVVTAQLGIDNIRAVPEPGAPWLIGTGSLALVGMFRRRFWN